MAVTYHDGALYVEQTTVSQDAANNRSYIRERVYFGSEWRPIGTVDDVYTHFDGDTIHYSIPSYQNAVRDEYRWIYHNAYGNKNVVTSAEWYSAGILLGSVNFSVDLPNLSSVPTVGTWGYDGLTSTSCATYVYLIAQGNNPVTAAGICYSNVTSGPNLTNPDTSAISVTSQNGVYQVNLTGLTPGRTYWFRGYATNGIGTAYAGEIYSFNTPPAAPTVTSSAATALDLTSATANGNVTSGGGITERGFAYGASANPTTAGTKITVAGTTGAFSGSITGLTAGTLYHYRPYATNSYGTTYGTDISFTTLQNPTVTSGAATTVLVTSATANGNLTNNGSPDITEKGFVYGTSANPTIANTKVIVAGTTTGVYTGSITGLTSNTTYHYRAYATSSLGTFYSADQSLTTDISYFTNPTNAYSSNNSYATAGSDSGVIAVRISKDGGTTWSAPKTNTYTSSEGYQTFGSATDTWGLSMTGADINSATLFLVKVTSGTTNQHSQIYKGFGYAETAGASVMGLQVQIEAKYASSTVSIDHIRVIPTMSGANADIIKGSTAYDSTLNTLTAYDGANWNPLATLATVGSLIYRVGDILTSSIATNPGETIANGGLGFGTWVAVGVGRVLVGKAASGTFSTAGATDGEETHTLSVAELAPHQHAASDGANFLTNAAGVIAGGGSVGAPGGNVTAVTGSGTAHNNLQPYEVVYYWKRTA